MKYKEIDPEKLYNKICAICSLRDKTIKDMADEIGVARSTVYTMVRSQPQLNTIFKIAQFLGCTVSHLIGEDPSGAINGQLFLDQFRTLSSESKEEVMRFINYLYYKETSIEDRLYPTVSNQVFEEECTCNAGEQQNKSNEKEDTEVTDDRL